MATTANPYKRFLPQALLDQLADRATEVIPGVAVDDAYLAQFSEVDSVEHLQFIRELYNEVRHTLLDVLHQREMDRAFIDARTAQYVDHNRNLRFESAAYQTVIGDRDAADRVVVGPPGEAEAPIPVDLPAHLAGPQVTLFGPPDSAKTCINAMNALHRGASGEPPLITELVAEAGITPRWGADSEDSKTPIAADLMRANLNLRACFAGNLEVTDARGRHYKLAGEKLAQPIKRIPGLALPSAAHLIDGEPLPLHIYDFAIHLQLNWERPQALAFYVPKLETPAEARYLQTLFSAAESLLQQRHPDYRLGSIKAFLVFENPRAIFRITEMANALHPYFVGGSLGWHDFLASTARLFRNDPNYRIPVKADPAIVINNILESHRVLASAMAAMGAHAVGGMYGVLPDPGNPVSQALTMTGYIRDVLAQLRRGLNGFWVAHPDFVRTGIALVEAWRRHAAGDGQPLRALIVALVPDAKLHDPLLEFAFGEDPPGLSQSDANYNRAVLAANVQQSSVIRNDDINEVRYNIFQAVQYLADWLAGNGCVALPASLDGPGGEGAFVRVMDDLATTERSRWEVWAEIHHGRISLEAFEAALADEMRFIVDDCGTDAKRIQVRYADGSRQWYPIACRILYQLMSDPEPVEFATELLMPFTLGHVRAASDPWATVAQANPRRYTLAPPSVEAIFSDVA